MIISERFILYIDKSSVQTALQSSHDNQGIAKKEVLQLKSFDGTRSLLCPRRPKFDGIISEKTNDALSRDF